MDFYKITCIVGIIVCIIFCYYIYNKNLLGIKCIENINGNNGQNVQQIQLKPKKELIISRLPKYSKDEVDPYFDIFIDNKFSGKIVFQLFDDIVPKTCANFKYLCSHNISTGSRESPSYQNSTIDFVKKDSYLTGGSDINYSIYGSHFADESFELTHNQQGLIAMYNDGPNKNNSKFMILMNKNEDFNEKYVVFGIIKSGYEIIEEINSMDLTNKKCIIKDCGLMLENTI